MLSQNVRKYLVASSLVLLSHVAHLLPDAGGLPFCYHNSRLWFLIGREGFGSAQGQWTDFGGKADKPSEAPMTTAAREFTEETRYVFGKNNYGHSIAWFQTHVNLDIQSQWGYHMFLVEVPFIDAGILRHGPAVPHYEKIDYAWVDANDFLNFVALNNSTQKALATYNGMRIRNCCFQTIRRNLPQIRQMLAQYLQQHQPTTAAAAAPHHAPAPAAAAPTPATYKASQITVIEHQHGQTATGELLFCRHNGIIYTHCPVDGSIITMLSSSYAIPFEFEGDQYTTVSEAFQAHNGHQLARQAKIKLMADIYAAKIFQNKQLRDSLRSTGNTHIINNTDHPFWGRTNNTGDNALGQILEQLRSLYCR